MKVNNDVIWSSSGNSRRRWDRLLTFLLVVLDVVSRVWILTGWSDQPTFAHLDQEFFVFELVGVFDLSHLLLRFLQFLLFVPLLVFALNEKKQKGHWNTSMPISSHFVSHFEWEKNGKRGLGETSAVKLSVEAVFYLARVELHNLPVHAFERAASLMFSLLRT